MTQQKTIVHLDASALKLSGCRLAMYRTMVQGYRSAVNNSAIEFGTAFHLFRKEYEENGGDYTSALSSAVKYFKRVPMSIGKNKAWLDDKYLMTTCEEYLSAYPPGLDEYHTLQAADGKPIVEVQFAYPYRKYDDLEILLCGTIDAIVYNPTAGYFAVKDYKTTSVWNRSEYLASYALSSQLMFYTYALNKYARLFPASVIAKACERPIGAFIDGVFLASGKSPVFERSVPFFYSDAQMAEFEKGLEKIVGEIVQWVRNPSELYREGMMNGSCEKVWGPCMYQKVCMENLEDMRQVMLDESFAKRVYNPLMFGKE